MNIINQIKKFFIKDIDKIWNLLTDAEKRVLIAKDVIIQINTNIYKPKTGAYINLIKTFDEDEYLHDKDVKSNFEKIKSCEVCALGSLLLSSTKYANKVNFTDIYSCTFIKNKNIKDLLISLFSPEQLCLIEVAFEKKYQRNSDNFGRDISNYNFDIKLEEDINKAQFIYRNIHNHHDRMIAIMNNIIKNKGTFKL